jgi:hypothetical protein
MVGVKEAKQFPPMGWLFASLEHNAQINCSRIDRPALKEKALALQCTLHSQPFAVEIT